MFEPIHLAGGGSRIGNSYLSEFEVCPRRWFYLYGFPTGLREDGRLADPSQPVNHIGLSTEKGLALHAGTAFHEAVEVWMRSGCRDGEDTGEYQLEPALAAISTVFARVRDPIDPLQLRAEHDSMQALFTGYHETFGPGGQLQDWPNIRVACDDSGEPMLEREYEIQLAPGWVFTCRPDAFIYENTYLKVMEHKTSSVFYAKGKLLSMHYETQPTAELYTLTSLYPDRALDGVLVNVVMKDRGKKSSKYAVAERVSIQRGVEDFDSFRSEALTTLEAIADSMATFDSRLHDGQTWVEAALATFPERGRRTERCYKFNRECEFYTLCMGKGAEMNYVRQFRTRQAAGEPTDTAGLPVDDFLL